MVGDASGGGLAFFVAEFAQRMLPELLGALSSPARGVVEVIELTHNTPEKRPRVMSIAAERGQSENKSPGSWGNCPGLM